MSAPKPATPLPWGYEAKYPRTLKSFSRHHDAGTFARFQLKDDAVYAAHAASACPRLVAALKEILGYPRGTSGRIIIECGWEERHRALLRELGEAE